MPFSLSPTDVKRAYTSDKSKIRGPERYFLGRLLSIVSSVNLDPKFSTLVKDIRDQLDGLKGDPSGLTDPFESIYGIVYRLTIETIHILDLSSLLLLFHTPSILPMKECLALMILLRIRSFLRKLRNTIGISKKSQHQWLSCFFLGFHLQP